MAKFCSRCGRPLQEGEVCNCAAPTASAAAPKFDAEAAKGFFESFKNRIGIGSPELNKGDAFETGKQIVPDCVKANESEIPVKQYTVATLRNRVLGIPYSKAVGRLQVTNKRVLFRARGRCFAGRTTLQHEFSIDELAGIEARREYVFNFWDLLIGLIVAAIGGFAISLLSSLLLRRGSSITTMAILTFLLGAAGWVPSFTVKKHWLLKLLSLGASTMLFLRGRVLTSFSADFWRGFFMFFCILSVLLVLATLLIHAIRPNLVLLIKTKSAHEAIDIRRKKLKSFSDRDEHTGYTEVLPADDADMCIIEINALINDIQKLGDFGIEKWKNK